MDDVHPRYGADVEAYISHTQYGDGSRKNPKKRQRHYVIIGSAQETNGLGRALTSLLQFLNT